jgi:hypothetical protein
MPEAKSLKELMQIRAHNRDFLDSINASLGTVLGFKKPTGEELTDQPAIIVFVPQKINPKWIPGAQLIPKKLEGPGDLWCPLDVVEGGQAVEEEPVPRAETELAERLRGWDDQVWAGSQIAHWVKQAQGRYSLGTLGAFARRREASELGFLTNQHVGIKPGQKLYHPVPWGTHLGTTEEVLEFVRDEQWYGPLIDEPNTYVRVDGAFVTLEPTFPQVDINPEMMGVGRLGTPEDITLDDMAIIGRNVVRTGRTTGVRHGTVVGFGYEYRDETNLTVYTDLLILGNDGVPFSTKGDSGSLIVTDDAEHRPVALLWGGWQEELRTGFAQEKWTYATAIARILDELNIEIVADL